MYAHNAHTSHALRAQAYGGARGHLGRGRPTHKHPIFKPGILSHGLFNASAFQLSLKLVELSLNTANQQHEVRFNLRGNALAYLNQ